MAGLTGVLSADGLEHLSDRLFLVLNPPSFTASDFYNFAPSLLR